MKKNKIYCVYCGEKNNTMDINCKKCNKKLNPKENMLLDYIKDHIKDDLKGKVEDNIFSIIKNFIISHLYGSILTATLIFNLVTSIVTTVNNNNKIVKVTEKPILLVGNINKCNFNNTKDRILSCEEGYTLEDNLCIKKEEINPKIELVCSDNYYLSNSNCISNKNYEKEILKECIAPEGEEYLDTKVENGACLVNVCAGWTNGECSAGSLKEIDFTITEYCTTGTSLINGVCKKIENSKEEKVCEEGSLEDDICIKEIEKEPKLVCEEGYTFDEECNICVGE